MKSNFINLTTWIPNNPFAKRETLKPSSVAIKLEDIIMIEENELPSKGTIVYLKESRQVNVLESFSEVLPILQEFHSDNSSTNLILLTKGENKILVDSKRIIKASKGSPEYTTTLLIEVDDRAVFEYCDESPETILELIKNKPSEVKNNG